MESGSYFTPDVDIAYIRIRSPRGPVRSDEQTWGLRDYDEQTGDLGRARSLVDLEGC